jgi:hypothetical protein
MFRHILTQPRARVDAARERTFWVKIESARKATVSTRRQHATAHAERREKSNGKSVRLVSRNWIARERCPS